VKSRFQTLQADITQDQEDLAHIKNILMQQQLYREHLLKVADEVEESGKVSKKQASEFKKWVKDVGEQGLDMAAEEAIGRSLGTASDAAAVGTATSSAVGGVASIAAVITGAMEIHNSNDPAEQAQAAVNIASGGLGAASAAMDLTAAVMMGTPVPGARVLAGLSVVLGGIARGVGALVRDITMKHHYEHHNQGTENLFDGNTAEEDDDWYKHKYASHSLDYFKNNDGDRVFGPNVQEKPEFEHLRNVILHATHVRRTLFRREGLFQEDLENFEPEELLSTTDDPAVKKSIKHLQKRHLQFRLADKEGGWSGWLITKDDQWNTEANKIEEMLDKRKVVSKQAKEDFQQMRDYLNSLNVSELHKLKKSDAWSNHVNYGFTDKHLLAKSSDEKAMWSSKKGDVVFEKKQPKRKEPPPPSGGQPPSKKKPQEPSPPSSKQPNGGQSPDTEEPPPQNKGPPPGAGPGLLDPGATYPTRRERP